MQSTLTKILLIEDDPVHYTLIVGLLKIANVDPNIVVWAKRLDAGLELLSKNDPDAVLLDLNLPDSCGLDTLVTVKSQLSPAPVVVITADDDEGQGVMALKLGAQDYLVKWQMNGPLLLRALHYAIERKRAEQTLRHARDFAEGLIESTQAIIMLLDTSGHILRMNAFAQNITGFLRNDIIGEDCLSLIVPSAEQPSMRRFLQEIISSNDTCLNTGHLKTANGGPRTIHWSARAIRDQEERISYLLFTGHDVTQLESAQQQLLDAERLAIVGQMITGLAHESRNALQRSQACLSMLTRVIPDNLRALDYAKRLQSAQDYLRHIFEEVRNYAAPLRLKQETSDIRQLFSEAWDQVNEVHDGKRIELKLHETELDLHCEVDPVRIVQVYRNVLENAISECNEPARISVDWSETNLNRSPALQVRVRDNGPGFSPEQRQKAFEPFYTTKNSGTGLGLPISRRIVDCHGGQIEIGNHSDDGHGAEILITLPRRSEL